MRFFRLRGPVSEVTQASGGFQNSRSLIVGLDWDGLPSGAGVRGRVKERGVSPTAARRTEVALQRLPCGASGAPVRRKCRQEAAQWFHLRGFGVPTRRNGFGNVGKAIPTSGNGSTDVGRPVPAWRNGSKDAGTRFPREVMPPAASKSRLPHGVMAPGTRETALRGVGAAIP